MLPESLVQAFDQVEKCYASSPGDVPRLIERNAFSLDALRDYLVDPGRKPYGRRVLFQSLVFEAIIMNWAPNNTSLPHDHGESEGWVRILAGTSTHHSFSDDRSRPVLLETSQIEPGTIFFAKKRLLHAMGNESDSSLVTLHFYFPPIHAMEVYDLTTDRAVVVADDCGAWWPDQDQVVRTRSLG